MTYQYDWTAREPRPIACIEAPDAGAAARITALGQQLENALERATGTAMTTTQMRDDNRVCVKATVDGTTKEVLGVMLAATALQIDERAGEHEPGLVRLGYWNDELDHTRTWIARWGRNGINDPENSVGRSLVSLAKENGAHWLWPGEARTDGDDLSARYGTSLENGENVLVAIVHDDGQDLDLWERARLNEKIAKERPSEQIAQWRAIREMDNDRIEYAVQAPTGCKVTEDLINALAQHRCSTTLTTYAAATGDTSQGDAGELPYALVRTSDAALGEASRQVNMALITSWHMHQHIDKSNPVDAPRVSVQSNEFITGDATRRIVSIVLDHSDLISSENETVETAAMEEEIEQRREAAKAVAKCIPSTRWLSHTGFGRTPEYNSVIAHNRWLDGIIGIIEEPKHGRWGNAEAISAMIDSALHTKQPH